MYLASFLNNLIKEDGFVLINANSTKYIIGRPKKENPITIKLLDKKLHYKLLLYPDLYLGESYTDGSLVIENGNLSDFLEIAYKNIGREKISQINQTLNSIRGAIRFLTNYNLINKSKKNVSHHYDISEKLYDLFLDDHRLYSCAYFKDNNESLESAQKNKIDHIIKKLNLKSDQRVLDIGSGWGTLAIEIAKQSKCEVVGITLSKNQLEYSINKAKKLNLENQVHFKLMDYREVDEKFDRIVSVGMFEHVGRKFYKKYFNSVSNLINDDGIALIHTIGSVNPPRNPQPWISKYIFPGGYTPSLSEISNHIENSGLILSDLEVMKMHYAYTLEHWKKRFLSKKKDVLEMFDEKFYRMWEFYLTGCEMAFKWGDQVVFQIQLTKNFASTPNTRDYIY